MSRRLATGCYALFLRAFSGQHRARYGSEMVHAFECRLSDLSERGSWIGVVGFVVAAFANAVASGLGERAGRRRTRTYGGRLGLGEDLRHAIRGLKKSWMFTTVCLFSLGAGMGVALAVLLLFRFTVEPRYPIGTEGLVELLVRSPGRLEERWSFPDFADLRTAATEVDLAGWSVSPASFRPRDGEPGERITATYVSPNFFDVLGIPVLVGRGFLDGDDEPRAGAPVVLGYDAWQSYFGGESGVLGRVLTVNRTPHVVVGVAPRGFRHHRMGAATDLWIPLSEHPFLASGPLHRFDRERQWLGVVGRMRGGATLERVEASVRATTTALASAHPDTNAERQGRVLPYEWQGARNMRDRGVVQTIFALICGVLLLIVCMNLAGMVLVRSATRERELALRSSIGSSRRRLVQLLMAEAVLIAVGGGLLTVAVGWGSTRALFAFFEHPVPASLAFDPSLLGLCAGVSFGTALVFGLLPALRFSRPGLLSALKDDVGGGGRRSGPLHRLAASVQAGVAVPVLVVAGGVAQGASQMGGADFGVEPTDLLVVSPTDLSAEGYDPLKAGVFAESLVEMVRAIPGVRAAGLADGTPLDGRRKSQRVEPQGPGPAIRTHVTRAGPGFFEALGVPVIRGRGLGSGDRPGSESVAVITTALADRMFTDRDPLGRRVHVLLEPGTDPAGPGTGRYFTVVGVTADVAGPFLESTTDHLFVPFSQVPTTTVAIAARTSVGGDVAAAIQGAARSLDGDLARLEIRTFASLVAARSVDIRVWSAFFAGVATLLLVLSALGIYGIVAFGVAGRTREIGVRMSLGSSRRRVLATVLGDAGRLALPGLAVGTAAGALVGLAVLNRIYVHIGLPLADLRILAGALLATLAVVVFATVSPARKAARVDPMVALRAD